MRTRRKIAMKNLLRGAIAGLVLIASGTARAADVSAAPVLKAPPAAPAIANWSGLYVGGHAGGAFSREVMTFTDDTGLAEDFRFSPRSFIGGGQIGIQQQWDHILFGVEGTWSGLDLQQTHTSALVAGRTVSFKLDELATGAGRLGYAWDQTLVYAKAGYAAARVGVHSTDTSFDGVPGSVVFGDRHSWRRGYILGAGLEYKALANFILGVEFDFYNFQFDGAGSFNSGTRFALSGTNGDIYSITARASYLFNFDLPVLGPNR
jgi:outer membrane immunogenic protein